MKNIKLKLAEQRLLPPHERTCCEHCGSTVNSCWVAGSGFFSMYYKACEPCWRHVQRYINANEIYVSDERIKEVLHKFFDLREEL